MTNTEDQHRSVKYMGSDFTVTPANGVTGVLLRLLDGSLGFRVYDEKHDFVDYRLRHDDLEVTISQRELASFYVNHEHTVLDHSQEVLGLEQSTR